MEHSLTNRKDNALSLPYLTEFVGDVKELEEQIFTLEGVRDRLQQKVVEMRKKKFPINVSPAQVYSHLKPKAIEKERVLTAADEEKFIAENRARAKDPYQTPKKVGAKAILHWYLIFMGLCVIFAIGVMAGIIPLTADTNDPLMQAAAIILFVLSVIITVVITKVRNASNEKQVYEHNAQIDRKALEEYRKAVEYQNEEIRRQNAQARAFNAELDQKNAEIDKRNEGEQAAYERRYQAADAQRNAEKAQHNAKISMLEKEHSHLCQTIKDLKERRSQLYALDIIPPSYRTYDCVHGLYDIFLNRKKDNMPDAVVLYDDYVFQGLLIKGMGTIIASLGQLTGMMTEMGKSISRMQGQISSLSMDMYDVAERQNALSDTLTSQHYDRLRESRLGRYELESISSSLDKIAKYCD